MVGQGRDDDVAVVELAGGPHADVALAGPVGVDDFVPGVDDLGAGREVGSLDVGADLFNSRLGVVDQVDAGLRDLADVVGQNVRRHADRDPGGPVEQDVGQPGRQCDRLPERAVEVRDPVGRAHFDLGQQHVGIGRQPGLRVAHGREIFGVVRGAPVALAVDQGVAVGEGLGHEHHGLIAGGVAVGVVFAEHVADGARRFLVLGRCPQAEFAHRINDAALNRFEPVADEGQGPVHDDVHGVVQIGGPDEFGKRQLLDTFHLKRFCTCH